MKPETVDLLIAWLEQNRGTLNSLDRAKITFNIANSSIRAEVAQNYNVCEATSRPHRRPPALINGHRR
jgi:hypothetical protein